MTPREAFASGGVFVAAKGGTNCRCRHPIDTPPTPGVRIGADFFDRTKAGLKKSLLMRHDGIGRGVGLDPQRRIGDQPDFRGRRLHRTPHWSQPGGVKFTAPVAPVLVAMRRIKMGETWRGEHSPQL